MASNASQLMVVITLIATATVYLMRGTMAAPTHSDVTLTLDVFNPCSAIQGQHNAPEINFTAPDLLVFLHDADNDATSLKTSLVASRLDAFLVNILDQHHWQGVTNFYQSYNATDRINKRSEILHELWRNLILYISYLRKQRVYEIEWSMTKQRVPTFNQELADLESEQLSELLCAVKIYSEQEGVNLGTYVQAEVNAINSQGPYATQTEHDIAFYLVLKSFHDDYVSFAKEMYTTE